MGELIIIGLCSFGIGMCVEFLVEHWDHGKLRRIIKRWLK